MGDLISRLQGDRVTLWRPDVKKQHRTRAPLDQKAVLSEAPEQRRGARCKAAQPRQRDTSDWEHFSANLAPFSTRSSVTQGLLRFWGWRWPGEPVPPAGPRHPRVLPAPGLGQRGAAPAPQGRESPGTRRVRPSALRLDIPGVHGESHTLCKPLVAAGALFPIYKPDPTLQGSSRIDDIYLQLAYVL